jgi:hypothetical protein
MRELMANRIRLLLTLPYLILVAGPLWGEEARVVVGEGPYYVDQAIPLRVVASGFEEQPAPRCEIDASSDSELLVQFLGSSPQVSMSIYSRNGRVIRSREVVTHYNYQVTARQPGTRRLGPFLVRQGNRRASTNSVTLDILPIESSEELLLELHVPRTRLYVGERLPVELRWGYAGDLNRLRNISLQVPLFDEFSYEDRAPTRQDVTLRLSTRQGTVDLPARPIQEDRQGRTFSLWLIRRELIADRLGEFEFTAPTLTARIASSARPRRLFDDFFAEDWFGDSEGLSAPVRTTGLPLRLEVQQVPQDGRPANYAGALGTGFQIEVSANRSVVRVGDPISLTIRVSGSGDLSGLTLPVLGAPGGLPEADFQVQDQQPTGVVDGSSKQFSVSVRVTRDSVRQIPAISFSWFNPQTEDFESTASQPIALQVMSAQVVDAGDVVRPTGPKAAEAPPPSDLGRSSPEPSRLVDYTGLDLAIETDPRKLISHGSSPLQWTIGLCYAMGLGILGLALWQRHGRSLDPNPRRLHLARRETLRRVTELQRSPAREAARGLSDLTRRMLAESPADEQDPIQRLLPRLDAWAFAPQGSVDSDGPAELIDQVSEWIRQRTRT